MDYAFEMAEVGAVIQLDPMKTNSQSSEQGRLRKFDPHIFSPTFASFTYYIALCMDPYFLGSIGILSLCN